MAQGLLPASYDAANLGRATSGAANTLLGLVYLTNGQKGPAADGIAPGRELGADTSSWTTTRTSGAWQNENNVESVFELQYKAGGTGTGSQFTDYYTPFGDAGGVGAGNAPQVLSPGIEYIHDVQYGIEENDERGWGGHLGLRGRGRGHGRLDRRSGRAPPSVRATRTTTSRSSATRTSSSCWPRPSARAPKAYGLINQVRARAGVTPISATTPGTFEEKLLFERRLEFVTEGKRWADLLRFGVAKQVMASFEPLVAAGLTQADIRLLYPIPQREIDVAPGEMIQNNF